MPKSVRPDFNSASFLQSLHDHLTDAVYLIALDTSEIIWSNKAGHHALLMSADEILEHSVLSIQQDIKDQHQWSLISKLIIEKGSTSFQGHHIRKDKSTFPVEITAKLLNTDQGGFFIAIARDLSEQAIKEEKSKCLENRARRTIEVSGEGLWDWDLSTGEIHISPSMKTMLGYAPDDISPTINHWKENIHPNDLPRVYQALEEHIDGKRERYDTVYRIKNRNGHYLWVHDVGAVSCRCNNGSPEYVTSILRNITDYKAHEYRLMELAAYDELTELRNRRECTRIFDKQITQSKRDNTPLSVCIFDLDHFKAINDQYGHLAGDQVLKEVSSLFSSNLRNSDFLFRWGGEEFVLLCPNTDKSEMVSLCEKLRKILETHSIRFEDLTLNITSSFGIASFPTHGNTRQEIMLDADSALYNAKAQGRNRVSSL